MKKMTVKWSIMLRHTIAIVLLFLATFPVMYLAISNHMYSDREKLITSEAGQLSRALRLGRGMDSAESDIGLEEAGTYVVVYSNDCETVAGSLPDGFDTSSAPLFGDPYYTDAGGRRWLVLDRELIVHGQTTGWFRVIKSLDTLTEGLAFLRKTLIIAAVVFIAVSILAMLSGGLVTRALSPVRRITKTAKQVGGGDLSKRIDFYEGRDDVGVLAETFNEMLDNIEDTFDREKRFSSNVSHELRTPVTAIIVSAEEALCGTKSAGEYRESLKTILNEGKRMNSLISQLLMMARSSSSEFRPETEPVDLSGLTRAIVDEVTGRDERPDITISSDIEDGITMLFDQTLYMRLVYNLVDNAIKYNVPGGWLKVSLKKAQDRVTLAVEDGGIGISGEDLPRIWERFYKADRSTINSSPGLGLSIVKWIAELFGGEASVKSSPGMGSLFEVRYPAEPKEKS